MGEVLPGECAHVVLGKVCYNGILLGRKPGVAGAKAAGRGQSSCKVGHGGGEVDALGGWGG